MESVNSLPTSQLSHIQGPVTNTVAGLFRAPGDHVTTPPITRLLNLRRIAQKAARTGAKLDPAAVLAVLDGRKA